MKACSVGRMAGTDKEEKETDRSTKETGGDRGRGASMKAYSVGRMAGTDKEEKETDRSAKETDGDREEALR